MNTHFAKPCQCHVVVPGNHPCTPIFRHPRKMSIGCPSCQVPAGAAELHLASSKNLPSFREGSAKFNALSLSNGDGDAFLRLLLPSFALPFPFQVGRIEDDRELTAESLYLSSIKHRLRTSWLFPANSRSESDHHPCTIVALWARCFLEV